MCLAHPITDLWQTMTAMPNRDQQHVSSWVNFYILVRVQLGPIPLSGDRNANCLDAV